MSTDSAEEARADDTDGTHPPRTPADRSEMPGAHITLLVAANFGVSMAVIVPMAYSLALPVDQLAPGNEAVVGYILGIAIVTLSQKLPGSLGRGADGDALTAPPGDGFTPAKAPTK
ncbi:hypothetical protein ABZ078_16000 [Streptomyces sp. NPDC006385]|uniref:hypothetical protein n=1 Tax=Streptomyces sp. NPDC006385 TaxID=3156761 RepID=UPI0033A2D0CB